MKTLQQASDEEIYQELKKRTGCLVLLSTTEAIIHGKSVPNFFFHGYPDSMHKILKAGMGHLAVNGHGGLLQPKGGIFAS